ncbi:hypothetical protein Q7C36_011364 [Tachysurus vachellii]|uniref:Uncharacterized protein n=1 Tax=Tachysurus vachellii TaxID=175792 RepID=A0AA88MRG5_TACVA|nr:hypothetical protein Q7C36_011364 [Tachysurus vachellii]
MSGKKEPESSDSDWQPESNASFPPKRTGCWFRASAGAGSKLIPLANLLRTGLPFHRLESITAPSVMSLYTSHMSQQL